MARTFGIVDLFAGPGGLGEGFSSYAEAGHSPFRIGISVEKEASAHRTLRLRAFIREYCDQHGKLPRQFVDFHAGASSEPDWSEIDPAAFSKASREARRLELGTEDATIAIDKTIRKLRRDFDDTILIGGPPCQAYSLVGRARSRGKVDYVPEEDARHYLFREYIRVLDRLRPAVFVMENVKGMLSSTIESRLVFEMLMEDLSSLGGHGQTLYELKAIRVIDGVARLEDARRPSDFIVRAEAFGVPQRRHRVIIVGVRADMVGGIADASVDVAKPRTVNDTIGDMPALRSGLSRGDDLDTWRSAVNAAAVSLSDGCGATSEIGRLIGHIAEALPVGQAVERSAKALPADYGQSSHELSRWVEHSELRALAQHETRGHMISDLGRYLFAAAYGQLHGISPKADDFPVSLAPNHKNWHSGVFSDRFRVQIATEPSTTITSHIAKDGHYFIHPDPLQCRSLTVREAARLQSFPDDYFFMGNRTEQYVQVGNAVPPFLARQIAKLIYRTLDTKAPDNTAAREVALSV